MKKEKKQKRKDLKKKDKKNKKDAYAKKRKKKENSCGRICLFIDTENISTRLPRQGYRKLEIYFYRTIGVRTEKFPAWTKKKTFHVQDIRNCMMKRKNELDFVIISDLAARLAGDSKKKRKKTKYIILSQDKGYDAAIQHLRIQFPTAWIQRVGSNAERFCRKILANPNLLELPKFFYEDSIFEYKAYRCRNYEGFRKSLTTDQRRKLRLYRYPEIRGIWTERNFCNKKYAVYSSGHLCQEFDTWQEAAKKMEREIENCPDKEMLRQSKKARKKALEKARRQRKKKRKQEREEKEFFTYAQAEALKKEIQAKEAAKSISDRENLAETSEKDFELKIDNGSLQQEENIEPDLPGTADSDLDYHILAEDMVPEDSLVQDLMEESEEEEGPENLFGQDLDLGFTLPREGLFF